MFPCSKAPGIKMAVLKHLGLNVTTQLATLMRAGDQTTEFWGAGFSIFMDLKLQEQTRKMNWGQVVWFTMQKSGGADVQVTGLSSRECLSWA